MMSNTWDPNNPETYELERLGDSGDDYITEKDNGYSSNSTFYFDARLTTTALSEAILYQEC